MKLSNIKGLIQEYENWNKPFEFRVRTKEEIRKREEEEKEEVNRDLKIDFIKSLHSEIKLLIEIKEFVGITLENHVGTTSILQEAASFIGKEIEEGAEIMANQILGFYKDKDE